MKNAVIIAAGIFFSLLILGAAGNADYQQAQIAEDSYCDRVQRGIHRDYNGRISCPANLAEQQLR